jgi:hypothetical protein
MEVVLQVRWGGGDFSIVNKLRLEILVKYELNTSIV